MIKKVVSVASIFLALSLLGTQLGLIVPAAAHEGHAGHQPAAVTAPARSSSPWGANYFPNAPLVTQDGKTVRFYDDLLKGKKVLINFIYAQCEESCPLDTANMARVQKLLAAHVGRDAFMYSITLDPEHDTPQVLKEYAAQFNAGPGWLFLTGKREDIDAIRFKLGQRSAKEQHANTVQIGDVANGRWIRVPLPADPHYIAVEADSTLFPGSLAPKQASAKVAEPERVSIFGPGQLLFYNRCAACHTIGRGTLIGPDLKGVTVRRERDWLIHFIGAPNEMRARKDPIALELARQYKVLMPKVELTWKELGDIMKYLEAQSDALAKPQAVAAGDQQSSVAHDHDHHTHQ